MSVIFGICATQGSIVEKQTLLRLAAATSRYGIDGTETHSEGRIGIGFQAFHTHCRSRLERQPARHPLGNVLALDGRVDNHRDLASRLEIQDKEIADSALVLEAFARWGLDCFSLLVGDWALALWSASNRTLYLARDHAGTRTLFYSNQNGEIRWSTYLETFFVDRTYAELDCEYIGRVLSSQRVGDLTPYRGIEIVRPAHVVAIREGQITARPHWNWIAETRIVYKTETEYDEHFRCLFRQAVERRSGVGAPVLAQLSGGMDSTSIVCMADKIAQSRSPDGELVDTVSYYDDTEPDWDERPYFTAVERHRSKSGIHLDCSTQTPTYEPMALPDRFYPYPVGDRVFLDIASRFEKEVGTRGYRAVLSGVGGDELLGGVPAPMPELADYLRAGRLFKLISRTAEWCRTGRQPLVQMLGHTILFTWGVYGTPQADGGVPLWLTRELKQTCLESRLQSRGWDRLLGARPSAINNGRVWWTILDTLPNAFPSLLGCYEYRYPFLDRDLVEFLRSVPREQLVSPGRRRLLMRRALKGIVPDEILERKRKAFMSHGPIAGLRNAQQKIRDLLADSLSVEYGLIDRDQFLLAFENELTGNLEKIGQIARTISVELWLRSLKASSLRFHIHPQSQTSDQALPDPFRAQKIRAHDAGR
jgi:asparagine synthase (glutamine-hydrolysing)